MVGEGSGGPRVNHLAVVVRDLARSEAFYVGLLGLPVIRRLSDEEGWPRSIWLGLDGGSFLALELAPKAERTGERAKADGAPGWHCLALHIYPGERDFIRRKLEHAGFRVERETPFTMYVRDPDGALVGLSHFPQRVSPLN